MYRSGRESHGNKELETEKLPFKVLNFFGKEFQAVAEIGRGGFGRVIRVKADDGEQLAVKVVSSTKKRPQQELNIWPHLKHRNILPLWEAATKENCFIFIMPVFQCTLGQMLENYFFRNDPLSFDIIKTWLHHITSGLKYLHDKNLCHQDLKLDNVMISRFSAVISDFGSMKTTRTPVQSVPRHPYHAPEVWDFRHNPYSQIFGGPIDIWDFGILALGCFTTFEKVPDPPFTARDWEERKYPAVQKLLQLPVFKKSLEEKFPGAVVSENAYINALNFIRGVLRFDVIERPFVDRIFHHCFLPGSQNMLFEADPEWKDDVDKKARRMSKEKMKSKEKDSKKKSPIRRLRGWFRKQSLRIRKCFCC